MISVQGSGSLLSVVMRYSLQVAKVNTKLKVHSIEACHGRAVLHKQHTSIAVYKQVVLKIHIKGYFLADDTSVCLTGVCRRAETGNYHRPFCWFVCIACLVSSVIPWFNNNKTFF